MFTWIKRAVVALENIGLVLVKHDSGTEKRLDVLIRQTAPLPKLERKPNQVPSSKFLVPRKKKIGIRNKKLEIKKYD